MRIVTSGAAYIDIDAYACCIAYAELLQLQGVEAQAVSTAPLNESISKTVAAWPTSLKTQYQPQKGDTFTLIDISDPAHFETFVELSRVDEVIDHHTGFEDYWQQQLGEKAQIEFIGSAGTLIYERWKAAGLLEKMSVLSARLLVCSILDNTLNFGAKVTDQRDIEAYQDLLPKTNLPKNWTQQYFEECETTILQNVQAALHKDTKILDFHTFNQPVCFAQLVVWDGRKFVKEEQVEIAKILAKMHPNWLLNLVSVQEGISYFLSENIAVQQWLSRLLTLTFDGSLASTNRLWLRKEVKKLDTQSFPL